MTKELQVYSLGSADGSRRIVAAQNKSRAAKLLDVSPYLLTTYGELCRSDDEIERALSDPGAVWATQEDSGQWTKIATSRKANALPEHGGPRPDSGRNRVGETLSRSRGISLDDERYAVFLERGGVRFLRQAIDSGLDLTEQEWETFSRLGGVEWLRKQMVGAAKKLK